MSFLQINNPDGTSGIKRPFRLSDIQDIWNGIKSLFKGISSTEPFRIISGFDLELGSEVYTSGTVWYNGELYEYDSNAYPITPNTVRVFFAREAQDNRLWEDGDELPFSYKYVCGGDTLNKGYSFVEFVGNIEKYKSYLGDGCVTTNKLENGSVTMSKLADNAKLIPSNREDNLVFTGDIPIRVVVASDVITPYFIKGIELQGTVPYIVFNVRASEYSDVSILPRILPLLVVNNTNGDTEIRIRDTIAGGENFATPIVRANSKKIIPLYLTMLEKNSGRAIYIPADTNF